MSGRSEEQDLASSRGRPEGLLKRWSSRRDHGGTGSSPGFKVHPVAVLTRTHPDRYARHCWFACVTRKPRADSWPVGRRGSTGVAVRSGLAAKRAEGPEQCVRYLGDQPSSRWVSGSFPSIGT